MGNLIYGVGINDADYTVKPTVNGVRDVCHYYQSWVNILHRCYNVKLKKRHPSYIGCLISSQWLTFSNFKAWMLAQDWQGKELDKDLLVKGNKIYSPETCVFVSHMTNTFITDGSSTRGKHPIGVSLFKRDGNFRTRCRNPFSGKNEHIGYFNSPDEAHKAWRKRKHELACQLAELQDDPRVSQALKTRYL